MSNVYIRCLVFQPTSHVVWANVDKSSNHVARKIPHVCPELDFRHYQGPEIPGFRDKLIRYKLIKPDWAISEMEIGDLPVEFKDTVKLMRAKCYASASIHRTTRSYLEKRDLVENYLLDSRLSIEEIGAIYSQHHQLEINEGIKLAQFKVDEITALHHHIHKILIETNLKFESAKTVEEVVDLYNLTQVSLGMHNPFDITTML